MTTWLFRQDRALRSLPVWLLVTTVNATALGGAFVGIVAHPPLSAPPRLVALGILPILWLPLWVVTFVGDLRTRCPAFALTVPVPTRRVWGVHVIANWLTGAGIVAVTCLVIALIARVVGRGVTGLVLPVLPLVDLVEVGAVSLAAWIVVVLVLERHAPAAQRIGRSAVWVRRALLTLAGGSAAAVVAVMISPWLSVLLLAAGAALFADRYRKLPASFLLPSEASAAVASPGSQAIPARAGSARRRMRATRPGRAVVWRTVLRCTARGKNRPWLVLPFAVLVGALIGGLDEAFTYPSVRFTYIPLAAYVLLALSAAPLDNIRALDPLPIARRLLWTVIVVPLVAALLVGYGIGHAVWQLVPWSPEATRGASVYLSRDDAGNTIVHVPPPLHRVAWNGQSPVIETPEGASFQPPSTPLVNGWSLGVYSPYAVPAGASRELVAWQVARAAHAWYGVDISPGEILSRYMHTAPDGSLELETKAGPFGSTPNPRAPYLPACVGSVVILWLLGFALYLGRIRASVSKRRRLLTFWGTLAVLFALYLLVPVLVMAGIADESAVYVFLRVLLARAGASPASVLVTWLVAAAAVTVIGALTWRLFRSVELPQEAVRAC